jgi:bacterioferritin
VHIEQGAVTAGYRADRVAVITKLNESLATETVCMLRYRAHHFMARGIDSQPISSEFLVHSNQEQGHADQIAARIVQLGGKPELSPGTLQSLSHADFGAASTLTEMIRDNLIAERIGIDSYRQFIEYLGEQDPTTRRMLESILATEEEHAEELADWLQKYPTPPLTAKSN